MKDVETIFKKAPWRPIPDGLDRKVEMELQKAEERRPLFFFRPVPLWVHVSICLACLCAGFAFHSLLTWKPGEPRLSYVVISNGCLKSFFDQTKTDQNDDSFKNYKVRIKTGENQSLNPSS
jgi:hypothetical protein